MDVGLKELESVDRESLILKMQEEMVDIMEKSQMTKARVLELSGINAEKMRAICNGRSIKSRLKWNEYLSLLFIFWKNDKSRLIVEEKGLFPKELKNVMLINRTEHISEKE